MASIAHARLGAHTASSRYRKDRLLYETIYWVGEPTCFAERSRPLTISAPGVLANARRWPLPHIGIADRARFAGWPRMAGQPGWRGPPPSAQREATDMSAPLALVQ